mgnify:FL=1
MTALHFGARGVHCKKTDTSAGKADPNRLDLPANWNVKRLRLTLGIICAVALALTVVAYMRESVLAITKDPATVIVWLVGIAVCLVYSKRRNPIPLAAEHTALPLIFVALLITGYYSDLLALLVIIITVEACIKARSVLVGMLHACSELALLLLIRPLFQDDPRMLSLIVNPHTQYTWFSPYSVRHWIIPFAIMMVAAPCIRLACDLIIFLSAGLPLRKAIREYSLSRILGSTIADLLTIIWVPELIRFTHTADDPASTLSMFLLAICLYSLVLLAFDILSRLTRSRTALTSLALVTDALPLPNVHPEQTVARRINRAQKRLRCFISDSRDLDRPRRAYRYSQRIDNGSQHFYIAFERGPWNRPFLPIDMEVLQTAGELLTEALRVNNEVSTLRTESETDALTGALTYQAFLTHLESLQTENVHNHVAIIYLEVEHLRELNTQYGRKIGNAALRCVADRLQNVRPPQSALYRVNGDEFALIVTDEPSHEDIEQLAMTMREAAGEPMITAMGEVSLSTSASMSFSNEITGYTSLLSDARAHVAAEISMDEVIETGTGDISKTLRKAIESGNITVLYRPIFNLDTRSIDSLSTVIRVHDEHGHTFNPHFVLDEARKLDISAKLTRAALDICAEDMERFREIAPQLATVGLCLNGGETNRSGFTDHIKELCARYPHLHFCLQMGSHAVHSPYDGFENAIRDLAAMDNVSIGLTHTGSSYSEVDTFSRLPITFAHIDGRVVGEYKNPTAARLMSNLVKLTDADGFKLVFDGVALPDQAEFVHSIGGTLAEGDLLSTAMTANELLMRLQTTGTALIN